MPKIRKIRVEDRKDSRGGGYSRRKFTVAEADAIREEYNTSTQKITISSLARKYSVSQPLMYQLIKGNYLYRGEQGQQRGYQGVQGAQQGVVMALKKEANVQYKFCIYMQLQYPQLRYCAQSRWYKNINETSSPSKENWLCQRLS